MLQLAQRTSAPSVLSVSISTAVWIVMCNEPEMRAPANGLLGPYSLRIAISPGISCSARIISLRPNGANERSATRKSLRAAIVDVDMWTLRVESAARAAAATLPSVGQDDGGGVEQVVEVAGAVVEAHARAGSVLQERQVRHHLA